LASSSYYTLSQSLDAEVLTQGTLGHAVFKARLAELISLTNPIARAIVCLESPHSTAADVLLFLAAALLMYEKTFADIAKKPIPGLQPPVDDIARILVRRYNELINSKNGHDAYFTTLILHPGNVPKPESLHAHKFIFIPFVVYLGSDVLTKPNPLNLTITVNRRPQHQKPVNDGRPPPHVAPDVANRGIKFLYDLLLRLKDSGQYPELNSLSKKQAVDGLKLGWESYIRRMWPFSDYTNDQDVLEWWRLVGKQPGGRVLSVGHCAFLCWDSR